MSRGSTGRWSPASTSAAPRRRSSSPTSRTASSTSMSTPTDRSSLVGQIAGLVDDARRQLRQDVAAVGVAIPGHVDPDDGSVSMAVNLGITHLPLGPMLQAELGVPIFVEHDARAAALWLSSRRRRVGSRAGERRLPGDRDRHLGRHRPRRALLRGDNGFAGEVGHVVADPDGAVCACGCAAASRRSRPVRRSLARPTRRSLPVAAPSCQPHSSAAESSAPARPATRSRSRSPTEWPTTWPERSDRSS